MNAEAQREFEDEGLCPSPLFLSFLCLGELASHKRLFNPPPQFSRLGTQGPAPMLCCVVSCVFVNVFCVISVCF